MKEKALPCPFCGDSPESITPGRIDRDKEGKEIMEDRVMCINGGCIISNEAFFLCCWNDRANDKYAGHYLRLAEERYEQVKQLHKENNKLKSAALIQKKKAEEQKEAVALLNDVVSKIDELFNSESGA